VRYGLSVESSEWRAFAAAGAVLTFGQMSTSDGTTYTERMRLDSSGNLGIGTSSPVAKLSVQDASVPKIALQVGSTERAFLSYTESNFTTRLDSDGPLVFAANNAEVGRFDVLGNLGIGTASPAVKLEIAGTSNGATLELLRLNNLGSGAGTQAQINFIAATNSYATITGGFGAAAPQLTFNLPSTTIGNYVWQSNNTERMRLTGGGFLGIATSAPSFSLDVNLGEVVARLTGSGQGYLQGSLLISSGTADSPGGRGQGILYFNETNDTTWYTGTMYGAADQFSIGRKGSTASYDTEAGTTTYSFLSITNTGNVGIGTAGTTARGNLDVSSGNDATAQTRSIHLGYSASDFYGFRLTNVNTPASFAAGTFSIQRGSTASWVNDFIMNNSGNVAIAEGNTPTQVLSIYRSGSTQTVMSVGNSNTGLDGTLFGVDTVGNGIINQTQALALILSTSNTERARITSGGDFGIGNSSPLYRLTVDKNTTSAITFFTNSHASTPNGAYIDFSAASPDNNTQYFLYCEDSTTARVILYSDGDGQNHDNSWGGISDERLKQDIVDANSQWDDIKNLRVRKYRFKSDVKNGKEYAQIGLIAQEVLEVSPGLVMGSEDTQYGVQYSILYMKAVKALQEAMTRIEQLEKSLIELKQR
jgi:hypothetical protein